MADDINNLNEWKGAYSVEYLGIKDPVLIEIWNYVKPHIGSSPGNPLSPPYQAALRAFDARIGALQEKSSNKMLWAAYIMLTVAALTLVATVCSIFR